MQFGQSWKLVILLSIFLANCLILHRSTVLFMVQKNCSGLLNLNGPGRLLRIHSTRIICRSKQDYGQSPYHYSSCKYGTVPEPLQFQYLCVLTFAGYAIPSRYFFGYFHIIIKSNDVIMID